MMRNTWPLSFMKRPATSSAGYRYYFLEFLTTANGFIGCTTFKCLDAGGTDWALQSNGATASVVGYTANGSFPVTNCNDGNDTSFTTSSASAHGSGKGIQIDLGTVRDIVTVGYRSRSDGSGANEALRTGNIYAKVNSGDSWTLIRTINDDWPQQSNTYREFPFTIPATASSTQWRIAVLTTQSGGNAIAREIELHETAGGADTTTGQTASSNSGTSANAIDNNTSTFWQASAQKAWWQCTHGTAKSITEFSWQIHTATGDGIKEVCLQYVNANGAWVSWWYPSTITWSSSDQVQVITKP